MGTVEFRDFSPSWKFPVPPNSVEVSPPARLEYPLNSVLSVAFNPNYPTSDHLVVSGLRCGIVRVSRVDYSTSSKVNNSLSVPINDPTIQCRIGWKGNLTGKKGKKQKATAEVAALVAPSTSAASTAR